VSQEEYDAVLGERDAAQTGMTSALNERDAAQASLVDLIAELDTAQARITELIAQRDAAQPEIAALEAEITALDTEIDDLQNQIDTLSTTALVEAAWERAQQRYATLQEAIEIDLKEIAFWLEFPSEPSWLDSAHLSSILLVDEPVEYEAVSMITTSRERIFADLSVYYYVTTMTWKNGDRVYEVTLAKHENGDIHRVTMNSGDLERNLTWTTGDSGISVFVEINENWRVFDWPKDTGELDDIYADMISWLDEIDEDGGLIAPVDQPMMLLTLGELCKPPYTEFIVDHAGGARRVAIDIILGIPASIVS
jgi:cell division protein FtsB